MYNKILKTSLSVLLLGSTYKQVDAANRGGGEGGKGGGLTTLHKAAKMMQAIGQWIRS